MKKIILLSLLLLSTLAIAVDLILDGSTIPLDANSTVTIGTNGDITVSSANGGLTCSASPPTLQNFTVTPATIDPGENITISWNVSGNATTCTKGGNWSGTFTGNDVINGNHSQTITNIMSSSTYTLQCSNSFGQSQTRTDSVTVNGSGANCSAQPPILGGNADTTVRLLFPSPGFGLPGSAQNPLSFDGTYDHIAAGNGWPGAQGANSFMNLNRGQYVTMSFTTDSRDITGTISLAPPGNGEGPQSEFTTIVISECPGDFTVHNAQPTCLASGGVPSLKWSQIGAANAAVFCKLDKNKQYYLSLVHSNSLPNYTTSGCGNSTCGILWNHTGNF